MAAEGPPPAKNDAPVTLQPGVVKMPDAQNATAATLSVGSHTPPTTEQPQIKGSEPPSVVSTTAAIGAPAASTTVDFTSMQETAKAKYASTSSPLVILGEGSFKRIIQINPNLAVAVVKEAGSKSLTMLRNECENLSFLSKAGLPAIAVHGNIFDINGKEKYAVLMESVPKHTFVDAKDPKTIKTTLPSVLLGVETPSNEAWFFKKTQIETAIKQNLSNPIALAAAKEKAGVLHRQLEDIWKKLDKNEIVIVDLQLLIDPQGMIKIIDPLEVMKLGPTLGTYLTLDGKPANTDSQFERSMQNTRQMLMEMIKFCYKVSQTTDLMKLKALITPDHSGAAASLDDELPIATGLKSKLPPSRFQASDSKAGGPRPSLSSAAGGGYRPSSRAGLHFSPMPPAIPLPISTTATNAPAQQNAALNQSQTATGTPVAPKDADNKPPIPPPGKGSPPPSPR